MDKLNHKKALFHAIVEKDANIMQYGTISYTIHIDADGNPELNTLKVSKNKRKKYIGK